MYVVLINPGYISVDEVIGFDSHQLAEQYLKDAGWEQHWERDRQHEWTKEDTETGDTEWALVMPVVSPSCMVSAA